MEKYYKHMKYYLSGLCIFSYFIIFSKLFLSKTNIKSLILVFIFYLLIGIFISIQELFR